MFRLALGTIPIFLAILALAISLGGYLSFSAVRNAYLTSNESRFDVVAAQLVSGIETAASLGIAVPEQVGLTERLAERASDDPLIAYIRVRQPDGAVLFESSAQTADADDLGIHVTPVVNDFGATVAEVVINYDQRSIQEELGSLQNSVLVLGGFVITFGAGVVAMLVLLILMDLRRRAESLAAENAAAAAATPFGEVRAALDQLEQQGAPQS